MSQFKKYKYFCLSSHIATSGYRSLSQLFRNTGFELAIVENPAGLPLEKNIVVCLIERVGAFYPQTQYLLRKNRSTSWRLIFTVFWYHYTCSISPVVNKDEYITLPHTGPHSQLRHYCQRPHLHTTLQLLTAIKIRPRPTLSLIWRPWNSVTIAFLFVKT